MLFSFLHPFTVEDNSEGKQKCSLRSSSVLLELTVLLKGEANMKTQKLFSL